MPMRSFVILLCLFASNFIYSQQQWILHLVDPTTKIMLKLDLYNESIIVPEMEMFGPMNGYLGGEIYGKWIITSFKIQEKEVILRFSNDLGSETQETRLTQTSDTTYTLKLLGNTVIKKVEGRKLVKIAPTLNMIKK